MMGIFSRRFLKISKSILACMFNFWMKQKKLFNIEDYPWNISTKFGFICTSGWEIQPNLYIKDTESVPFIYKCSNFMNYSLNKENDTTLYRLIWYEQVPFKASLTRLKCYKLRDDNGCKVMIIPHLNFCVSWGKWVVLVWANEVDV